MVTIVTNLSDKSIKYFRKTLENYYSTCYYLMVYLALTSFGQFI